MGLEVLDNRLKAGTEMNSVKLLLASSIIILSGISHADYLSDLEGHYVGEFESGTRCSIILSEASAQEFQLAYSYRHRSNSPAQRNLLTAAREAKLFLRTQH